MIQTSRSRNLSDAPREIVRSNTPSRYHRRIILIKEDAPELTAKQLVQIIFSSDVLYCYNPTGQVYKIAFDQVARKLDEIAEFLEIKDSNNDFLEFLWLCYTIVKKYSWTQIIKGIHRYSYNRICQRISYNRLEFYKFDVTFQQPNQTYLVARYMCKLVRIIDEQVALATIGPNYLIAQTEDLDWDQLLKSNWNDLNYDLAIDAITMANFLTDYLELEIEHPKAASNRVLREKYRMSFDEPRISLKKRIYKYGLKEDHWAWLDEETLYFGNAKDGYHIQLEELRVVRAPVSLVYGELVFTADQVLDLYGQLDKTKHGLNLDFVVATIQYWSRRIQRWLRHASIEMLELDPITRTPTIERKKLDPKNRQEDLKIYKNYVLS